MLAFVFSNREIGKTNSETEQILSLILSQISPFAGFIDEQRKTKTERIVTHID